MAAYLSTAEQWARHAQGIPAANPLLQEPLFRLAQWRMARKSPGQAAQDRSWFPVRTLPDDELARLGWHLAGQGRDASALSESERAELYWLCVIPHWLGCQTSEEKVQKEREQKQRRDELLARCPFTRYVAIVDIDVNDDNPEWESYGGPDKARRAALQYTHAFDASCDALGWPRPVWACSDPRKGSMHGEWTAPAELVSTHLSGALLKIVRTVAKHAGIPVGGGDRRQHKPLVFLDPSPHQKQAAGRGGQWRLIGSYKSTPEGMKQAWDRERGCPGPRVQPLVLPLDKLQALLVEIETEAAAERAAELADQAAGQARRANFQHQTLHTLPNEARCAPLTDADLSFIDANEKVKKRWEKTAVDDRSIHMVYLCVDALQAGADEGRVIRLCWNLPPAVSKIAERANPEEYILNALRWAKGRVARFARKRKLVVNQNAPKEIPPTFNTLGNWCMFRCWEAADPKEFVTAFLYDMASWRRHDKRDGKREDGTELFPWKSIVETLWQAAWQALNSSFGWSREDVWRCAYEQAERVADTPEGKDYWASYWLGRVFGLPSYYELIECVTKAAYWSPAEAVARIRASAGRTRWTNRDYRRKVLVESFLPIQPPKRTLRDPTQPAPIGPPAPESPNDFTAEGVYTRIYCKLQRASICRHTVDVGSNAEGKKVTIQQACQSLINCPMCATVQHAAAFDLLTKAPGPDNPDSDQSWVGRGGVFHATWVQLPSFDHVEGFNRSLTKKLNRASKLRVLSANPETGEPVLLFLSEEKLSQTDVLACADYYGHERCHITTWEFHTRNAPVAAKWALDACLAPTLYLEKLLRTNQQEKVREWNQWWKGRQVVLHRRKTALPYPSREQLKAYLGRGREKFEDGEEVTWQLFHKETGYLLHESEERHTIDQVSWLLMNHQRFNEHHQEHTRKYGLDGEVLPPAGAARCMNRTWRPNLGLLRAVVSGSPPKDPNPTVTELKELPPEIQKLVDPPTKKKKKADDAGKKADDSASKREEKEVAVQAPTA